MRQVDVGIEKKGKYISRVYAFTARFRTLEYPSNITSFDCIKIKVEVGIVRQEILSMLKSRKGRVLETEDAINELTVINGFL